VKVVFVSVAANEKRKESNIKEKGSQSVIYSWDLQYFPFRKITQFFQSKIIDPLTDSNKLSRNAPTSKTRNHNGKWISACTKFISISLLDAGR